MLEANLIQGERQKDGAIGKNVILSVSILAAVMAIFGGLFLWKTYIEKKVKAVEASQKERYAAFMAGNASPVIDFKSRSVVAENLLKDQTSAADALAKIEESLLPQVYLNSYDYDKPSKEIKLDCAGDSFNTAAKQILSFKQSGYFAKVAGLENKFDAKEKKVDFTINLTLK